MNNLHLYDFGIFIELEPDEEEKQMLENNIQMAITQQSIDLEDAIDLRMIKNVKLANQLLKIRRKKKQEKDQELAEKNIKAQSEANADAQKAIAQAEVEKNAQMVQSNLQLESGKAQLESKKMMQEAKLKKELMAYEFQLNMQLEQMKQDTLKNGVKEKEDRKDERTRIQATQQSDMIDQRNQGKPPKNFESTGNDQLGTGFDLGMFEPR